MNEINNVILSGWLEKPAQLSATASGFELAKFGLWTSRAFRGRDGMNKEKKSLIECAIIGAEARRAANLLLPGVRVIIQGALVQDAWRGASGEWQHATRVEARDFQILPPIPANAAPDAAQGAQIPPAAAQPAPPAYRQGALNLPPNIPPAPTPYKSYGGAAQISPAAPQPQEITEDELPF